MYHWKNNKKTVIFIQVIFMLLFTTACGGKEPVLTVQTEQENVDIAQMEVPDTETSITGKEDTNATDTTDAGISDTEASGTTIQTTVNAAEEQTCYIHICGAVKNPGVYPMKAESRIYEAVALAGGFGEDACIDYLNQAEKIQDGEQVRIPTRKEVEEYEKQSATAGSTALNKPMPGIAKQGTAEKDQTGVNVEAGLVDLNTATVSELCTLPGIGSQKANSIITYREQNGGFKSIEDLLRVNGIKDGTFQKLKDKIRV